MKLAIDKIDITDFNVQDCQFAGDDCVWIFPKLEGTKWTTDNLHQRSSIWRKSDGLLVSAGFKKFFNWAQEPTIYPPPDALTKKINVVEKLDGSCLVVSKYKGELITRTRRALAKTMLNGDEISLFEKKHPEVFNNPMLDTHSLLFEWMTPSNRIVVGYEAPEIRLIGAVDHDTYAYASQKELDSYAHNIGVKRPKYFSFTSIEEMLANIAVLKGEEGVCVYYGNDQHIRKIKSDWYLSVHNFRNAMNLKNIVDLYLILEQPDYENFCLAVLNQYQYEGLAMAKPLISMICDGMKEVKRIEEGMKTFIASKLRSLPNRKLQAEMILSSYGTTNRADMVFTLLDNKPLNQGQTKKLLFQVLAK